MGPIGYFSDVSVNLPNELSIFLDVKAFEQKHLHKLIPFYTRGSYSIFLQDRFHSH